MGRSPETNPRLLLLKALVGCAVGGIAGAVLLVFLVSGLYSVFGPLPVKMKFDDPYPQIIPIFAAPIGGIIGAVFGASLAMRRL